MTTNITDYTTNEEVQDIIAYYTDSSTGAVDYDAIATAIENNDTSAGNIEDLITAYVSGTGPQQSAGLKAEDLLRNDCPRTQNMFDKFQKIKERLYH